MQLIATIATTSLASAIAQVEKLSVEVGTFRLASAIAARGWCPDLIAHIKNLGCQVYYDTQLIGSPEEMVLALDALAELSVDLVSVEVTSIAAARDLVLNRPLKPQLVVSSPLVGKWNHVWSAPEIQTFNGVASVAMLVGADYIYSQDIDFHLRIASECGIHGYERLGKIITIKVDEIGKRSITGADYVQLEAEPILKLQHPISNLFVTDC